MHDHRNIAQVTGLTVGVNGEPLHIDYRNLETFIVAIHGLAALSVFEPCKLLAKNLK